MRGSLSLHTSQGLVFFEVFCPSPCMTCFILLVMGLGPMLIDFSSLGFSPFCVLSFCLLFGLQFFLFLLLLLVPVSGVIYLFIYKWWMKLKQIIIFSNFQLKLHENLHNLKLYTSREIIFILRKKNLKSFYQDYRLFLHVTSIFLSGVSNNN